MLAAVTDTEVLAERREHPTLPYRCKRETIATKQISGMIKTRYAFED